MIDPDAPVEVVKAPVPLLVLAGASALVGLGLLFFGSLPANVAGYLFGSVVTVSLVALFRRTDLHRRCSPFYAPDAAVNVVATLLLVAGIMVAVLNTWPIATELAK